MGKIEELLKLLPGTRRGERVPMLQAIAAKMADINALIALLHSARRSRRNFSALANRTRRMPGRIKKADVFREGGQDVDDGLPHALRADCDPKVKPLCGEIIHSQRRKIDETKTILQRL